ncbi:MAG: metallophosphoesterase family protein [Methanomassiliicoccales archaeon]
MSLYEVHGRLARVKDIEGDLLVVGDLHGDWNSFERAVDLFLEGDHLMVFLGDYADRGPHGLEIIEGLQELLEDHGDRVIALKGNHEDYREGRPMFVPADLPGEVEAKRPEGWRDYFPLLKQRFLDRLSLAALLPGHSLMVHGGICPDLTLEGLVEPGPRTEEAVLWSDPHEGRDAPNPRGVGTLFGPDTTHRVLDELGVRYLIRSHEPRKACKGPVLEHGGKVITVSSTSACGGMPFLLRCEPGSELSPGTMEEKVIFL